MTAVNLSPGGHLGPAVPPQWISDADTLLQLLMDGAPFEDTSSYARTVTVGGTVSQSGGTAVMPGTNSDYFELADSADWAFAGDFTVEFFFKVTGSITAGNILWWNGNANSEPNRALVWVNTAGKIELFWKTGGVTHIPSIAGASALTLGQQYHCSMQRISDGFYLHIDGVLAASITGIVAAWSNFSGTFRFGEQNLATGEFPITGTLGPVRVSKVARYGAGTFTPPAP